MADRYQRFVSSRTGAFLARRLGLPRPVPLRRYQPGQPVLAGPVTLGQAEGARAHKALRAVLDACGATVADGGERPAALVYDATGIEEPAQLAGLHAFFHPRIRSLAACGRLVVLGTPPEAAATPGQAAAQRALEGFVRSAGKELRNGATAHLLYLAPGAEEAMESTLRFVLSARSAYVSGQALRLAATDHAAAPGDWDRPLAGSTAVITGAARGIGEAIATVLRRDGARVLCVDVPAQAEALRRVAGRLEGEHLELDITAPDAGSRLADRLGAMDGGPVTVVHNAGITRDKTLGRMDADRFNAVLSVNLLAAQRLTDALLPLLGERSRIVAVSSMNGIAGAAGQTNYAASKAGLIGLVQALAPRLADQGVTVNAVAPGFIETAMTAAMPLIPRQAGRRLNSLSQGGLPVDVAEAVAYFASPGSAGVTGQVLRVCGQSLLGA
ncbi:3-oxoacyl-ACP reductase [Streptomyces sp. 7-21]|uniref:3-oxoacyl-ACP reductase n=1 Tax=Streptomyces sp. 7-21 TaxID=2802283 RepID=UPI001920044C|nr:3-oxoacyl-ACP reductase [Streptomyces sp. 7-21]MBL1066940.1 3-oxoacyl-ACP reductase [Streptomyces sp. 7-21]